MKNFVLALLAVLVLSASAFADRGRTVQVQVRRQPVIQVQRFNTGYYHNQNFRVQRVFVGGYSSYNQQVVVTEPEYAQEEVVVQKVVVQRVQVPTYTPTYVQPVRIQRVVIRRGY